MKKEMIAVTLLLMMLMPTAMAYCIPVHVPSPKLSTTVKNPQWMKIWNGITWVYNTPIVTSANGRTLVTYPIPAF